MSKRYMDFVPVKNVDKSTTVAVGAPRRTRVAEGSAASTTVVRTRSTRVVTTSKPKVMMPEPTATPRTRLVRRDVSKRVVAQKTVEQRPVVMSTATKAADSQDTFTIRSSAKLGEVEDLSPKFVNMDVPKRPLGDGTERKVGSSTTKNEVKEAKSKKLIGRFRGKSSAKANAKGSVSNGKKSEQKKDTFVAPKPTFINQDKVAKRPLSKNVYQKKVVATNEKTSKGPVAIIAKPEKESKAGLIVTIILTIILGAVAGTVAFLLLPK